MVRSGVLKHIDKHLVENFQLAAKPNGPGSLLETISDAMFSSVAIDDGAINLFFFRSEAFVPKSDCVVGCG